MDSGSNFGLQGRKSPKADFSIIHHWTKRWSLHYWLRLCLAHLCLIDTDADDKQIEPLNLYSHNGYFKGTLQIPIFRNDELLYIGKYKHPK